MSPACCAHGEDDHRAEEICDDQIHYPSEDYPCLCHRFVPAAGDDRCAECGHRIGKHLVMRTCHPASGESCSCRTIV